MEIEIKTKVELALSKEVIERILVKYLFDSVPVLNHIDYQSISIETYSVSDGIEVTIYGEINVQL